MKSVRMTGVLVSLMLCLAASGAETPAPLTPEGWMKATGKPLSKTVGIHTAKRTENPDGTVTLLYRWEDGQLHQDVERSVILNENTVIGIHGELKQLADVTEEVLRAPSVASVGPDEKTTVMLRIGREKIKMSAELLTAKQIAQLKEIAPEATEASNKAYDERVSGIVAELNLNDPTKEKRVQEIILKHQLIVRDNHNAGFAPPPTARVDLIKGLDENLTPEQVDQVKDALTNGMLMHTFGGYHAIVPDLTEADDEVIMAVLRQAREAALDLKKPEDLGRTFEPYKKAIEQYITARGTDWRTAYKTYTDGRRAQ